MESLLNMSIESYQNIQTSEHFFLLIYYNLLIKILVKNNLTIEGSEYLENTYIIKDNTMKATVT